jgi:hypothetical protein
LAWTYEFIYLRDGVAGVGMKRSEMIQKLASQILVGDVDLWLFPIEAKAILDRLEELGMRPPSYIGLMANGKEYNPETDFARDTLRFHDWEPE